VHRHHDQCLRRRARRKPQHVYSHLKKIREKTGCKSVPDLIRKFGELNVPLRLS
jgi:DNA-binding CsgD family transcriptional regulator